jgi:hypothetical protein
METDTRVLVCDDDGRRAEVWAAKIRALAGTTRLDVVPLTTSAFAEALEALAQRRENAREEHPSSPTTDAAAVLDQADILIVDFDLTPSPASLSESLAPDEVGAAKERLRGRSGEQVAYLARCYSTAGFLVVVNQEYQRQTFDLTMQRFGHSYADINVTHYDLTAAQLWLGDSGDDVFHPWNWPRLRDAADLQRGRVAAVTDLHAPVLESLGIIGVDRSAMTARQLDPLGDSPDTATFDDLVHSTEVGLQVKDVQQDPAQRRRIAAAAAGRWLETLILPAQNVIVDAPHTAQRFPQLLGDGGADVGPWQELALLGEVPEPLTRISLACDGWLSRPAWSASAVREAMAQLDLSTTKPADVVFCEDVSRFVSIDDATEFETDLPGPYDQRFVRFLDGIDYHPRTRLLS